MNTPDTLNEVARAVQNVTPRYMVLTPVQRAAFELFDMGFNIAPTKPANAPNPRERKLPFMWRLLVTTRINRAFIPELFDNRAGILVVTGRLSMNLTVLDCETLAEFEYHRAQFQRRGLSPWIVGTARGGHFWWLSANGELANVKDDQQNPRGWEIRGNCCYIVAPPTVHPTGLIYEWIGRAGLLPPVLPISVLDWLPLEPALKDRRKFEPREPGPLARLAQSTREFMTSGAAEGTRNNRLFAAACDLAGNGYSFHEARAELAPAAERSGLSRAEISATLNSAFSTDREPAKKGGLTLRAEPDWTKAAAWAGQQDWRPMAAEVKGRRYSVSAETARRVFLACVERARREHGEVWRASTRELGELAQTSSKTAHAALVCFVSAGWLRRCGYMRYVGAGLYAFAKWIIAKGNSIPHPGSVDSVTFCNSRHDAFSRRALGPTGERVWKTILLEPLTAAGLARRLKVAPSTVGRSLKRLAQFGLAGKAGRVWHGNPAGDADLNEIAAKCGTLGAGERRREKNCKDRAEYASKRILRAKRGWEQKNLKDHEALFTVSEVV